MRQQNLGILENISTPSDIKGLTIEQLGGLCSELRSFLIESVSKTGGHFSSNLGVVELSVALHRVFDTLSDRVVFDVGHQSYIHKMITGRLSSFATLRKFGGMSGFPKPEESVHDAFIAGHASNSISVALGMARARTLTGGDYKVVAIVGDGALTGGLTYEALSDAGEKGEPLLIILNDNGMSITDNVGGIARYLARRRMKPSYIAFKRRYRKIMDKIPGGKAVYRVTHRAKTVLKNAIFSCSLFEDMGLQYLGPVDGHNLKALIEALSLVKDMKEPVVLHVLTKKGKGYPPAEQAPEKYHGVKPFDPATGVQDKETKTFSSEFGRVLTEIADTNEKVCAITASMASGTGLTQFAKKYPDRFFDVGIAEGHAVALAAGMASRGIVPVFAVYSTFLQRAYDMMLHDVGIGARHVVFGIDRAGLVSGDGETHQGTFDISYLSTVPQMTVFAPSCYLELKDMLKYAVNEIDGPVAVRYPRGSEGDYKSGGVYSSKIIEEGSDVTIVTHGYCINIAEKAVRALKEKGISAELIKLGRVAPIDFSDILDSARKTRRMIVLEDVICHGGVGERIAARLSVEKILMKDVILMNTGDKYIPGGDIGDLLRFCGIDCESVCNAVERSIADGGTEA